MQSLKNKRDFSRVDAFRSIDIHKMNSIFRDDLRAFFQRNGEYANGLDVENLMKRMDLDGDGRISFSEFCDFLEQGDKSR